MTAKNKNKKSLLTDFLRYKTDEMTGEERNSFEKKLQKDPFAEEAAEGFSLITSEAAKDDFSVLQNRLFKKIKRRSRSVFYRIAAAVAVLMVVSSILIVIMRKDQFVTISENAYQEKKAPVYGPQADDMKTQTLKEPDKKQVFPPSVVQKSKKVDRPSGVKVAEREVAEPKQVVKKDSEVSESNLSIVTADETAVEEFPAEKKMDMARAAGASAKAKSEKPGNYIPPQPVVGKDSFDIYLEKNILNPEPENPVKQVVELRFKVLIDSTMTGFFIISSPGRAWSKEAIRLIKSGPVWKPAEKNGKLTEGKVSISILFK